MSSSFHLRNYEPRGRGFKSCRARQFFKMNNTSSRLRPRIALRKVLKGRMLDCLGRFLGRHDMAQNRQLTAIIEREGDGYVALCPELDIASQGTSIELARTNLKEALELFFESADPEEIKTRLHDDVFVTRVEVAVG